MGDDSTNVRAVKIPSTGSGVESRVTGAILAGGVRMSERVTVKVPATTANLGPGFDCLGMALDIWNSIDVQVGPPGIEITGEGEKTLPRGPDNLVARSLRASFEEAGLRAPEVRISCRNEIPLDRGLGSSSAAVVGGLAAGNELAGRPLDSRRLLELAESFEGHPDNVAPALLGGCRIVVRDGESLITALVPVPETVRTVLFIPDVPMPTDSARKLLSDTVSRRDAVYNIGRAALLVRAFATGDKAHLAEATQDRLHQPERRAIFPAMGNIIRAAIGAGALGAFLSGAGSTVIALAEEREFTIGYEMADAAAKSGIGGSIRVTGPTARGAHTVEG